MSTPEEAATFDRFKQEIAALWETDQSEGAAKEREVAKQMCRLEGWPPDALVMEFGAEPLMYANRVALLQPIYPVWTRYLLLARTALETARGAQPE